MNAPTAGRKSPSRWLNQDCCISVRSSKLVIRCGKPPSRAAKTSHAIPVPGRCKNNGRTSMNEKILNRRVVVAGLPFLLAACSGRYSSITGEPFSVPFVPMNPALMRQEVSYRAPYRPGTVVVNLRERRLYLVQTSGQALRYAVGVGRAEGAIFHGSAMVGRKETWPSWTPTAHMMRTMPH